MATKHNVHYVQVQQQPPVYNANATYVQHDANNIMVQPVSNVQYAQQPQIQYVHVIQQPIQQPVQLQTTTENQTVQTIVVQTTQNEPPVDKDADDNGSYLNPSDQKKKMRMISAGIAILGALLLFIGLCTDSLSKASFDEITHGISGAMHCGWKSIYLSGDIADLFEASGVETENTYSDMCDTGDDSACSTSTAALGSLSWMVWATIMAICSVIWVQPFMIMKRCSCCLCCINHCPLVLFILSGVFAIFSIIIWSRGNDVCVDSGSITFSLSSSMILEIVGMILILAAIVPTFIKL